MMDHVITGKTGYTSKAGYCYVAALEEGGDIMQSHFLPAAGRITKIISI